MPYLCLKIRVSLDQDRCPVSVYSLRVLLAPVPAHVLCVHLSLSLSLSPTSPVAASLSLTSLALAFLPALSPASLSLVSLALASLAALA